MPGQTDENRLHVLRHAAFTARDVREMERPLLENGVPLMRMASAATAHVVAEMIEDEGVALEESNIVLLAGSGDNGGDGLFAATILPAETVAEVTRRRIFWMLIMKKLFEQIGRYFVLMGKVFSKPEKMAIYRKRILAEIQDLGLNSIGIVAIISVFMGAVITIQMALNLESPFIPKYLIGYAARESMLLEFSSTVVALILAGKVGSNIASEIGTMRITEQIDALEIMGVNSASYLILPKIIGTVFFFPFLTILSMIIGVAGGYVVSILTGAVNPDSYIVGVQYQFKPFYITYSLIKSSVFAFIITSISGFYGYFANGNSLEVGRASTQAVVVSSIVILIFNLILTQLLLT